MGDQVTPPAQQRADLRELRTRGEKDTQKVKFFYRGIEEGQN
jgi:hypothetical protein